MGQLSEKMKSVSISEVRVPYDETSNNGFIIEKQYIPEELLLEILCHVDYKSLLKCQLVCKRWNVLIQDYVWRKKAEMAVGRILPVDEDAPWTMYYYICDKKFDKNLIKNHSGNQGLNCEWKIIDNGGDGWAVEFPPIGVPELPDDPVFENKKCCFVTSYYRARKYQVVDLIKEGINEHLLDTLQPPVLVSEWYSSRWDCPAVYMCEIELVTEKDEVLDSFAFQRKLEDEDQNQWFKFEHKFENYGKGLRKIRYVHGGQDARFWAGYYGSKMAGACIKLDIPNTSKKPEIDKQIDIIELD